VDDLITDILYLTFNRLEFTRFTLQMMIRNTDWHLVRQVVIYDDSSEDGTREYLDQAVADIPVDVSLRCEKLRSPVAVMNRYMRDTDAHRFVKIDSDIAVPPRWLTNLSDVMDGNQELDLLGMEGGRMGLPRYDPVKYGYTLCTHIGGVGLMRTHPFREYGPIPEQGRFGFGDWQQEHGLVRGWITPDLLVCELDKVPIDPWVSLSQRYIAEGWQRQWGHYDNRFPYWYEWFDPAVVAECTADEGAAE